MSRRENCLVHDLHDRARRDRDLTAHSAGRMGSVLGLIDNDSEVR